MSDEAIIRRVLRGDLQCYRELMDRYLSRVIRIAHSILNSRDDAEDAAQEAFLHAYENLASCRDRSRFWPWLRRIAVNICLSRLSSRKAVECTEEIDELPCESGDTVLAEVIMRAAESDIRKSIAGLPPEYRTVLVLKCEEGLSHREIAETLGDSYSSVQVRLYRARKMLAKRLEVISGEL